MGDISFIKIQLSASLIINIVTFPEIIDFKLVLMHRKNLIEKIKFLNKKYKIENLKILGF